MPDTDWLLVALSQRKRAADLAEVGLGFRVNMDKVWAFRCQAYQFSNHSITAWRWSLMQFIDLVQP
jgi:hypothetical protein